MSLRRSVISGSVWTVLGFGTSQILRLASNIILAAILFQEAFALMAIASAIVQGLAMFSDLGIAPSVVQNKRGDDRTYLDTAWTIQVLRGVLLTAIACALAWPVASFYAANDPSAWELVWLLPMIAIGTLISGFQSSNLMTAARHLHLARITSIDLAAQFSGMSSMILVAWLTKSVFALPVGTVVAAAMTCTLSHLALPGQRNRFRWDKEAAREIVSFGKWVFLSTLIFFFVLQLDKLIFGRLFPLDEVGVYSIAASLALLTPTLLGRLQSMISFPLYSRMLDRASELAPIVSNVKIVMFAMGGFLVALSIAGSLSFIDFAYDHRYADAGAYISILAIGAWFSVMESVYGAAFLASGRADWVARVNGTKVVAFVVLVFPFAHHGGLAGAILAVSASDAIKALVTLALARRLGLKLQASDWVFTTYTMAVGFGVLWLSRSWSVLAEAKPIVQLIAELVIVSCAFAPLLFYAYRAAINFRSTGSPGPMPENQRANPEMA